MHYAMNKNIKEHLEKNLIIYTHYKHQAIANKHDSHESVKHIPGIMCKNLFLKEKEGTKYILVTLPINKQLDIKKLEKELNIKKISFASTEELNTYLKTMPGHVSPFAIMNDIAKKVIYYIDKELWDHPKGTSFHPGINTETIHVTKNNFHKLLTSFKHEIKIILL